MKGHERSNTHFRRAPGSPFFNDQNQELLLPFAPKMDHYHDDMSDMPDMPTSPPAPGAWCSSATAMGNGFTNHPTGPTCILYLFNGWVLNSPVKYGFAVIGTFCWCMAIPYVGRVRRRRITKAKVRNARLRALLNFVLYFVQLLLAYAAMLLTMTFSVWIFLSVVSGIAAGHTLFSHGGEDGGGVAGGARPGLDDETCCADLNGKHVTDSGSTNDSVRISLEGVEKCAKRNDKTGTCCNGEDLELGREAVAEDDEDDDDHHGPIGTA